MRNRSIFVLLLTFVCFGRIDSHFLSFGHLGCRVKECVQPYESCYFGRIYDVCGCQQCAPPPRRKVEGERCGTTLYPETECAPGLLCMTPVKIKMCRYSKKAIRGFCVRVNRVHNSELVWFW